MLIMKKALTVTFLLFFCLDCFAQSDDIETLKKLNHDWISSYLTKDTATMGKIYADDMILINPSGKAFNKKDLLRNLVSPGQGYLSAKVDTVSVRLAGNIGLVNAQATVVDRAGGKTNTITTCYLDVYEKRNGRWYAIASQVTLLSVK
jgi:ketosteroid isomerase-like protein